MATIIELDKVTCFSEEGRPVFDEADLRLNSGERVLLAAPIASGKSLLVKLIAGLERPVSGRVLLFGQDISELSTDGLNDLRKRMAFIFQENALISNLKAVENVALPLLYHSALSRKESMDRAMQLLDLTGFRADPWTLPGHLPVYAKKEVALARALITEPEALICESFWDWLTEAEKEHLSSLVVRYHRSGPGRLLLFSSVNESDSALLSADRVIKIEANRFAE